MGHLSDGRVAYYCNNVDLHQFSFTCTSALCNFMTLSFCCSALALLQNHGISTESYEGSMEAPEMRIREAEALHKFAEAAYTVLL